MSQTEVKIIEPEVTIKIAFAQPIGVIDEALLDPANMSSGAATAGQIPTADGVGGIAWADDVGPVPVSRQILNGTGITGGGDLSADRTLAVDQSALDPSNMSSGAASSGQLLTAGGGGATSWADAPESVGVPASSTDNALTRWDGAGGNALQNSNVTLSDGDAMVFPAAGSISKPGAGANSEAFGSGAETNQASATAIGPGAKVHNVSTGVSAGAIAIGSGSEIGNTTPGAGCGASIAIGNNAIINAGVVTAVGIGPGATIHDFSSQDNTGAIAIGKGAAIGSSTPGIGSHGAIAIGMDTTIGWDAGYSIAIGENNTVNDGSYHCVVIGYNLSTSGKYRSVLIGAQVSVTGNFATAIGFGSSAAQQSTAYGSEADATGNYSTAVGQNSKTAGQYSVSVGAYAEARQQHSVTLGHTARVYTASGGTNDYAIAIGRDATIGTSTPGAASRGAIAIGGLSSILNGHTWSIALGHSAVSTAANRCTIGTIGGSYDLELQTGKGFAAFGATPPSSQPAKISDATDLASAITAVNAVIDVLEGAGLSSSV